MQLKLLYKTLDDARQQNGDEFWYARDLWQLFGYGSWRNFQPAVEKARESCKTTGEPVESHFVSVRKMAKIGLNQAEREIDDYKLIPQSKNY